MPKIVQLVIALNVKELFGALLSSTTLKWSVYVPCGVHLNSWGAFVRLDGCMLLSYLLDSSAIEWLPKRISLLLPLSKFFLFCFVLFFGTRFLCVMEQAVLELAL